MAWPRGFDLRSMEVFLAVADSESMAAAAKAMNMTQAGISQYISKIEAELDTLLVDRSLRPVRLSPAGAILRDRARRLFMLAEETRVAVRDVGKTSLPELRFAVVNSIAGSLLPQLFDQLEARFRLDNFCMWSGLTNNLNEALINRDVDLILTSESMENIGDLERIELVQEPFILVVPKTLRTKDLSLKGLARDVRFLRYCAHNAMGRQIDVHLRRLQIHPPHTAEFDSSWSISEMLMADRGWAIMTPLCLLEGHVDPKKVQCLPFPETPFFRRITLVTRAGDLGPIPQELAAICGGILRQHVTRKVSSFGAWLSDEIEVMAPEQKTASETSS